MLYGLLVELGRLWPDDPLSPARDPKPRRPKPSGKPGYWG